MKLIHTILRAERRGPRQAGRSAFTLIEVMVTITLLMFIIIGLLAVFNQTQRAFTSSMNQSDVLEAGRAVFDNVTTEFQQMMPAYGSGAPNFFAELQPYTPLVQNLPGTGQVRTNLLEDVFMVMQQNRTWIAIGYVVRTNDAQGNLWLPISGPGQQGAGSLYRYTYSMPVLYTNGTAIGTPTDPNTLFNGFKAASQPGLPHSNLISNRLCDGVVHFRFRAFNTNGVLIVNSSPQTGTYLGDIYRVGYSGQAPGEVIYYEFYSNAVPPYVELEMGLLAPKNYARFNSISDPGARLAYAQREDVTAAMQIFRQRVAVRSVDPIAFQ